MLIGVAGPCANFALTLALMFFYYSFINEVTAVSVKTTTVEWVTPGSAAAQAGLQSGDVITRFDGVNNPDWDMVYEHMRLNANQSVPVTVERGGQTLSASCRFLRAPRATASIRATREFRRSICQAPSLLPKCRRELPRRRLACSRAI